MENPITYLEYTISVAEKDNRFTASVSRAGGLIEHDGRASEVWVSASCNSHAHAVSVAKTAIDTDRIR